MATENPQQFTKPQTQSTTPPADAGVRIFTMPEKYRHGAHVGMHQPQAPVAPPPVVEVKTPAPPVPSKAPPKAVLPPTKKNTSHTKKLLMIGGVFVFLLALAGYLVVLSTKPAPEQQQVVQTTRPTPETQVEPEEVPETPPVEEEEPEVEEVPEVFPVETIPGVDSDSDGLTDVEETEVYGTHPKLPDTDSDGFLDGNEVFHRYNPAGTAPGTLFESGLVKEYVGAYQETSYQFYLPSVWKVNDTDDIFVLEVPTGEGFLIGFQAKQADQALKDWVSENTILEDGIVGSTKNGLGLVQAENQLTAYVDLGTGVMIFTYDTGIKTRIDYLQSFQMMLNSVTVKK